MVEMHSVVSTDIEAIGYDATSSQLYVRFLSSGQTYVYPHVPQETFEELMVADSKGKYFNQNIKPIFTEFYKQ